MRILNFKDMGKALLCALSLLSASPVALAEWIGNTDLGIRYDSNINNAQLSNDIVSISALSASVSETGFFPLENGNSLSITGESKGEAFDQYNGLNNVSLGTEVSCRKKWTLGAYAPWTGLSLSSTYLNFANTIRNGWKNQIAVRGGQRIFERWDVRAEYMIEQRTAEALLPDQPGISGDVFSQSSRTITLNAEYTLSDSTSLTFGSLFRLGDVVASTRETTKIISSSKAIALDPVFGPGFYAYRMNATTYGLNVDMNFAVTPDSLLRASVSHQLTHTDGGNDYAKNVAILSWNFSY